MTLIYKRGLFFITFLVAIVCSIGAQPTPQLDSLYPKGFQRSYITAEGNTASPNNRITLYGKNLQDISEVMMSGDGVESIEIVERYIGNVKVNFSGNGVSGKVDEGHRIVIICKLSPNAELSMRQLRVVTPNGVSNPLNILVGDIPEQYEEEPNNDAGQTKPLNLPVTINGVKSSSEDIDHFRFLAKKGQRIFCEVNASRIGSPLDSFLELKDENGKEVARNDIANGLDSMIDYQVEKDGEYVLSLRDLRYKGGGNYFYRLSIGVLPYLDTIFPLGGKRGSQSNLQVNGKNIGNINSIQFAVAPDAPIGFRNIRITPSSGISTNPQLFDVDDLNELTESEENNETATADAVSLPIIINGKMNEDGDIDYFAFEAKNGQRFVFEVFAKRLGTKLDGFLELLDPQGNVIKLNDDTVGAEARIDHRFDADGRYQIAIRDLSNLGGDEYAYRLKIQPIEKNLAASVNFDNPRIAPNGSTPLQFNISRSGGLSGAVRIELQNLPHGISHSPAIIPANQNSVLITLNADQNIEPGMYKISALACAADDKNVKVQTVSPGAIYLTVLDHSPYSLEVVDVMTSVDQMKSTQVKVKAIRAVGFTSPIQVQLVGNPDGLNSNTRTIPENQTDTVINISSSDDTQPGLFFLSARSQASVNNEVIVQHSPAFPISVNEAPFTVDVQPRRVILPLSAPASNPNATTTEEVEVTVSLNRKGYFDSSIEIVPNLSGELIVMPVTAQAGQSEIKIKVSAPITAKADTYTISFTCTSNVNGRKYQQQTPGVSFKLIQSESLNDGS